MNGRERQIFDLLCQHGDLRVQQLSELLEISPSSVRRDLNQLLDHRFIRRTRGGAALSNLIHDTPLPIYKLPVDPAEARAIAGAALRLIEHGDVIGLSGGRLCTELALQLRMVDGITVVTNAVNIAAELVALPGLQVMVTGGQLNQSSFELVGQAVGLSLNGVRLHKFFVGTDGLSVEHGLSNHGEAEALAAREMIQHAGDTYVLADSSKFRRPHLARVAAVTEVSGVITTDRVPRSVLDAFCEAGVQMLVTPVDAIDPMPDFGGKS